jgi:hypothetical protein
LIPHLATLQRRESGWILSYPLSRAAISAAASATFARQAPAIFEASIPLAAEHSEGALFLAGIILQDHIVPNLSLSSDQLEPNEWSAVWSLRRRSFLARSRIAADAKGDSLEACFSLTAALQKYRRAGAVSISKCFLEAS